VSFSKDKAGAFQAQFLGVILGRKFLGLPFVIIERYTGVMSETVM